VKERVLILGGGMVGIVAQRYVPHALILDWGAPPPTDAPPAPPQQWGAIYWWQAIADIPCFAFPVVTTIDGERATDTGIAAYKSRVGKGIEVQSRPESLALQFRPHSIGFSPVSFPTPTRIQYRAHVTHIDLERRVLYLRNGQYYEFEHLIATIPLPSLLDMCRSSYFETYIRHAGSDVPAFKAQNIYVTSERPAGKSTVWSVLRVDYHTRGAPYRTTIHLDGAVHREYTMPPRVSDETKVKRLIPGRIYDEPDAPLMVRALAAHRVRCFGRYARWDSDELLHITDADIRAWVAEDKP
jgi:hypothetical protein